MPLFSLWTRAARARRAALPLVAGALLAAIPLQPAAAQFKLSGAVYRQNFDALPMSGVNYTASSLPAGFAFVEVGVNGNDAFSADDGDLTSANTYSFGAARTSDRAFGEITSGVFESTIGASFLNNTGFKITSFTLSYTGEQWRLGAADATNDRLDFQFSTNATSLNSGTWTDVQSLDFVSPATTGVGAKDGNLAANRHEFPPTAIPVGGLPAGGVMFIRWVPSNITGANDGLAIDDVVLSYNPSADFDLDGDLDGADFLKLQRNLGTPSGASNSIGDANRDGAVDPLDQTIFVHQFRATTGAAAPLLEAVPEPSSTCLIAVLATAIVAVRRSEKLGAVTARARRGL